MNQLKKVVAYCRVSTNKADQENSFETQQAYFKSVLTKENGYELVGVYADKGISATSFHKRPQFEKMLVDGGITKTVIEGKSIYVASRTKEPLFNYIYVTNTSRFSRNDEVNSIINELKKKSIYIEFSDLGLSTENPDNEITIKILQMLDSQFSEDLSKKVKSGIKRTAMNTDKIRCSRGLYGYDYDKYKNTLTQIPEEANVVKMIFNLYVNGDGFRTISNKLANQNIFTRNGTKFSQSSLKDMISNEKYVGINNPLRYKETHFKSHTRSSLKNKSEIVLLLQENHPRIEPIIDIDTFNKANNLLLSKAIDKKGVYGGKTIYANKLFCSCCNATYTRNSVRKKPVFNCSNKKRNGATCCENKMMYEDKFLELVNTQMKLTSSYKPKYKHCIDTIDKNIKALNKAIKGTDKATIIANINKQIKSYEEQRQSLIQMSMKGIINHNDLELNLNNLDDEILILKQRLSNPTIEPVSNEINMVNELIELKDQITQSYNQLKSIKDIQEFISICVDKIFIKPNSDIEIILKFDKQIQSIKGIF